MFKPQYGQSYGKHQKGDVFFCAGNEIIDGVRLRGGSHVDAIQFRANGKWIEHHGGTGGKLHELEFDDGEYITSAVIELESGDIIDKLTFYTNHNNSISAGKDGNQHKEPGFGKNAAILIGIKGSYGDILNQVQFRWGPANAAPFNPTWGSIFGRDRGKEFDEMDVDGKLHKITGVKICGGDSVDSIQFQVDHDWKIKHGGVGGGGKTLILAENEYFSTVYIKKNKVYNFLTNIKLTTNKLRSIEAGSFDGDEESEGAGKILINCRGRCGNLVDQLQFQWMDDSAYTYNIVACDFDLDTAVIGKKKPKMIASIPITNNSEVEQSTQFKVDESENHESSFEETEGFEIEKGATFETGIPNVGSASGHVTVTDSQQYTWGETNSTIQRWSTTYNVVCPPHKSVVGKAIVTVCPMDIKFTITVKNGLGDVKKTVGVWKGVTTANLSLVVDQID